MTLEPGAADNTDCDLVTRLWNLLGSPESGEWYLGNIIRNGLTVPALGIDIPAFPTVSIGDIPEQVMFEWALERLAITMTGTVLSGLDSFDGGDVRCTPVSDDRTDVTLTLRFRQLVYNGDYRVGASGVTGCALATAAALLGKTTAPGALKGGPDPRLELAAWYRDDPKGLPASENGKILVGAYYLHEDTIEKVTTAPASEVPAAGTYRQVLSQQKPAADAVNSATLYYQQQEDGDDPPGPPPEIGDGTQYSGGFKSYTYLNMAVQQMREQADLPLEPGNEFADLQNAMLQFNAQVKTYQRDHPGEHDTAEIMRYVAQAPQVPLEEFAGLGLRGIPVHAPDSEEEIDHVPPWPIDRERALQAHAARAPRSAAPEDDWFHVNGTFADRAQTLAATGATQFTNVGGKLHARVSSLRLDVGSLHITLGNKAGFDSEPGLYDRVATWIANTGSFQDTLISKLNSGLNEAVVLDYVSTALNAGLRKLGLQ